MTTRTIGIVVEGATGRLGTTQHLRSLMAIRGEGGLVLGNGERLVPEPVLLGRNPEKLAALAAAQGGLKWSTDRDACLADPEIAIISTRQRLAAGQGAPPRRSPPASTSISKSRSPATLDEALDLARGAQPPGSKTASSRTNCFCRA